MEMSTKMPGLQACTRARSAKRSSTIPGATMAVSPALFSRGYPNRGACDAGRADRWLAETGRATGINLGVAAAQTGGRTRPGQ